MQSLPLRVFGGNQETEKWGEINTALKLFSAIGIIEDCAASR